MSEYLPNTDQMLPLSQPAR